MNKPTYIYWCITDSKEKFAFLSQANLRIGATVYDDDMNPATIVEVDMELPHVGQNKMREEYERMHKKYELMRGLSM